MEIEAGKTYVSEDGRVHGPMIEVCSNPSVFVAAGSVSPQWDLNGISYSYSSPISNLAAECERPTIWSDMTDAEKGVLLLARYEGKEIEALYDLTGWVSYQGSFFRDKAYRIKPEPKVVKHHWTGTPDGGFAGTDDLNNTLMITFNTINGEPDLSSIKMEKI